MNNESIIDRLKLWKNKKFSFYMPHTIDDAIVILSYFIEQAICDTEIKIAKSAIMDDRYVVSCNRQTPRTICAVIDFDYLDKNEVFNKLSNEHQCWLILNEII